MNNLNIAQRPQVCSQRISSMQFSPIRKLYPLMTEAQDRGITVLQLNIGQPDIATPIEFFSEDLTKIKTIAYGPSDGLPSYKKALSDCYKRHGIAIEPEELIITTAGSEAILFSLFAVCDAGEEIIIPEPYYTNYNGFCALAGIQIKPVSTTIETGFSLPSVDVITSQVTDNTKAILICNPNNPTGAVYPKEVLGQLLRFCTSQGLMLIVDEVYRDFVYEQEPFSILQHPDAKDQVIMIDSLSKRYSTCGARLGSIATKNTIILQQVMKCAQSRLCPPTLEQVLAQSMIASSDNAIKDMKAQYRERIQIIEKALKDSPIPVTYSRPKGAFYIMAALPVVNAEDFARFMLEEYSYQDTTVFVAPAEGFYKSEGKGRNEIRIAAVLEPEKLTLAMNVLISGLSMFVRKYHAA